MAVAIRDCSSAGLAANGGLWDLLLPAATWSNNGSSSSSSSRRSSSSRGRGGGGGSISDSRLGERHDASPQPPQRTPFFPLEIQTSSLSRKLLQHRLVYRWHCSSSSSNNNNNSSNSSSNGKAALFLLPSYSNVSPLSRSILQHPLSPQQQLLPFLDEKVQQRHLMQQQQQQLLLLLLLLSLMRLLPWQLLLQHSPAH